MGLVDLVGPVPFRLPGGGFAAGDAADHEVDRGPADHGFGHGRIAFVVAGQAAVRGQLGSGVGRTSGIRAMSSTPDLHSGLPENLNNQL